MSIVHILECWTRPCAPETGADIAGGGGCAAGAGDPPGQIQSGLRSGRVWTRAADAYMVAAGGDFYPHDVGVSACISGRFSDLRRPFRAE